MLDWKWVLAVPSTLTAIIVGLFGADARYQHKADADAQAAQYASKAALERLAEDSEQSRLEFQLQIAQQRVDFLRSKRTLTAAEQDDLNYQIDVIAKLRARLEHIVKGG